MRQRRLLQQTESIYVLRSLFRVSPLLIIIAAIWLLHAETVAASAATKPLPAVAIDVAEPARKTAFNSIQLQNLIGPIALYSDDLLALVLSAAAHPLQAISAARRVNEQRNSGAPLDYESDWHPSVIALTHYPQALERFDQDLQWAQHLHRAVLEQNAEVLEAVQAFRRQALQSQVLTNNQHIVVERQNDFVRIRQRHPEVMYVPDYQPQPAVIVHHATIPSVRHRTHQRPIVYRSSSRFDPHRSRHFPNDPFWRDPFWSDPLWGISGGVFLSWQDHRWGHHMTSPPRTKRWQRPHHQRIHKGHRAHAHVPRQRIKSTKNRIKHWNTDANRGQRRSSRHHHVDAFNQPMFGNQRGERASGADKGQRPRQSPRRSDTSEKGQRSRRYTPDKRPIMATPRSPSQQRQFN